MVTIESVATHVRGLKGVQGVLVAGSDGAVVHSALPKGMDPESLARLIRHAGGAGRQAAAALERSLVQSFFEYGDRSLIQEMFPGEASMVVLAAGAANIGRIRLELRKIRKAFEAELAEA